MKKFLKKSYFCAINFIKMVISIELQTAEEFQVFESVLLQFKAKGIIFNISPAKKRTPKRRKDVAGLAEKLHGCIELPADFDYKSFLTSEILTKHSANG